MKQKLPIKLTNVDVTILDGTARLMKTIDKGTPFDVAYHLGQWWTLSDLHERKDYGDLGPFYSREDRVMIVHMTALVKARLALCSKKRRGEIAKELQGLLARSAEESFWEPDVVASGEAAEITKALIEQFNI